MPNLISKVPAGSEIQLGKWEFRKKKKKKNLNSALVLIGVQKNSGVPLKIGGTNCRNTPDNRYASSYPIGVGVIIFKNKNIRHVVTIAPGLLMGD